MSFFRVFGYDILTGLSTVVNFPTTSLPGVPEVDSANPYSTVFRIGVGLDMDDGLNNAGGDLPNIDLWGANRQPVGQATSDDDVDDGQYADMWYSGTANTDSPFIMVSAAQDNALCVAYIGQINPSGGHYGWVGDWGPACGAPWYYSNVTLDTYSPKCTWVDKNGDQPTTGFFIWQGAVNPYEWSTSVDPAQICKNGVFEVHTEENPVPIWTAAPGSASVSGDGTPSTRRKTRALEPKKHKQSSKKSKPRDRRHDDRLVITNKPSNHAAEQLCSSESSVGPDFLNTAEGQFCRMSDHTLWPVCSHKHKDNCFNVNSQQLIVNGVSARGKGYGRVTDWSGASR